MPAITQFVHPSSDPVMGSGNGVIAWFTPASSRGGTILNFAFTRGRHTVRPECVPETKLVLFALTYYLTYTTKAFSLLGWKAGTYQPVYVQSVEKHVVTT